jgi:hypothetical protein
MRTLLHYLIKEVLELVRSGNKLFIVHFVNYGMLGTKSCEKLITKNYLVKLLLEEIKRNKKILTGINYFNIMVEMGNSDNEKNVINAKLTVSRYNLLLKI